MINLFSNIPAVNPASASTRSGVPVDLRQAGDRSCYSSPPDFKLNTFFHLQSAKNTGKIDYQIMHISGEISPRLLK